MPIDETNPNRRDWLRFATGLAAGSAAVAGRPAQAEEAAPRRSLRLAHLTDTHVDADRGAPDGLARCLRHVNDLADKPDLILFGGDAVMDACAATRDQTQAQWALWDAAWRAHNTIPVLSVAGNHDLWGWNRSKSGATGQEPDFGRRWAIDALKMPGRYHATARGGWHLIGLDSVRPTPDETKFAGYLDDEQFAWLEAELARVPSTTPVLLWSHMPILAAAVLAEAPTPPAQPLDVSPLAVHSDTPRIVALLGRFPNVRAALSGHLHQVDHVAYKGVDYYCDGAVCGSWWKGPHLGFAEGYAVLDLFADGSTTRTYQTYGWTARASTRPGV